MNDTVQNETSKVDPNTENTNSKVAPKPELKEPEVKVSNPGTLTSQGKAEECCNGSVNGVYAFVSNVPGSRAYVGQMELEDGTTFDGWCTFNPTGKALANSMMPGIIFYSHGVYVTSSKLIADKLMAPLKARRPMLYRAYKAAVDPEITAYLKDPSGKCVIEGVCE